MKEAEPQKQKEKFWLEVRRKGTNVHAQEKLRKRQRLQRNLTVKTI